MYPGKYAKEHPNRPAIIMATSGEVVTYQEYDRHCNQLAHLLRDHGLNIGDHYAVFMENNIRFVEACGAGERSGLYYTPINSYLKADELAYIINNCDAQVLITSSAKKEIAREALASTPNIKLALVVDDEGDNLFLNYQAAISDKPSTPIKDETLGSAMLYSSGTTGRPKGILRPLMGTDPAETLPISVMYAQLFKFREEMTYLSPAPLYHAAPLVSVGSTIRYGGTVVIMERFDAELYLQLVEQHRVTHSQLVPTMFSRMLKLPNDVRRKYDVSSLESAIHAAAPCPIPVKEQMIDWWGPIIYEYYSSSEGLGLTYCDSKEWLEHKGTVGRVVAGDLHILDDDHKPVPCGTSGELWFSCTNDFEYYKNKEKTKEATSSDGSKSTVGDIGYLDDDGYLYLTDRSTFMIISGGVNIYPQECENLLITHPKVADAAVFGVPNPDLGEEVKAVIQPMPDVTGDERLAAELIEFCKQHLSVQKSPRSIDFEAELPRLPTGKLYKKELRERYWKNTSSLIV